MRTGNFRGNVLYLVSILVAVVYIFPYFFIFLGGLFLVDCI